MGGGLAKAQAAGEPAVPRPLHAVERFDEFYLREYRATVTLAWALSGSCLVAEDLAQEAFMLAWRQWPQIGGYQQPAAGVRRVVANLATHTIRRRLAEARAVVRVAAGRAADIPELSAATTEVWRAVRAVPGRQAQVLALHYLLGCPVSEIATIRRAGGASRLGHAARPPLLLGDHPTPNRQLPPPAQQISTYQPVPQHAGTGGVAQRPEARSGSRPAPRIGEHRPLAGSIARDRPAAPVTRADLGAANLHHSPGGPSAKYQRLRAFSRPANVRTRTVNNLQGGCRCRWAIQATRAPQAMWVGPAVAIGFAVPVGRTAGSTVDELRQSRHRVVATCSIPVADPPARPSHSKDACQSATRPWWRALQPRELSKHSGAVHQKPLAGVYAGRAAATGHGRILWWNWATDLAARPAHWTAGRDVASLDSTQPISDSPWPVTSAVTIQGRPPAILLPASAIPAGRLVRLRGVEGGSTSEPRAASWRDGRR
jgi:RNA polymerase sigma-70 factor, ECF subfamily